MNGIDTSFWVSGIILLIAVFCQLWSFARTVRLRQQLEAIFPKQPDEDLSAGLAEDDVSVQICYKNKRKHSRQFESIVSAINNYLKKNSGAADYSTLKDITDRQTDTLEAQIDALVPVPIYIGLCGTVLGIVIGVGVLSFGEGLDSLLTISAQTIDNANAGAQGIKALLQGVSVAMVSTLSGVVLSIIGAICNRKMSRSGEERKNDFLNWMQGELLPQMKHDMASTLSILQKNLAKFNKDFASNSSNLNDIFKNINTSYKENTKLLEAVQRLDVNAMAEANIKVLQELQACTNEINDLHTFLDQSNRYLKSVEVLNGTLNDHLDRTKMIENMAQFFHDEILQISQRKDAISRAVGDIDLEIQKSIESLSNHTSTQYQKLIDHTATQHLEFLKAVEAQQKALNSKLEETSVIVDELKNLVAVKDCLNRMMEVTAVQNEKIDGLLSIGDSLKAVISKGEQQSDRIDRLAESVRRMVDKEFQIQVTAVQQSPDMSHECHERRLRLPVWSIVLSALTSTVLIGTSVIFILRIFGIL